MLIKFIKKIYHLKMTLYIKACQRKGLHIGEGCRVMKGTSFGSEPHLVSIGDEVLISFYVSFVTHDGATWVFRDKDSTVTKFAPISVGKRAFIGARAIILPGVTIGERSVIAAGSIVNKNVPAGEVWGGVPAKKIMTTEDYYKKLKG